MLKSDKNPKLPYKLSSYPQELFALLKYASTRGGVTISLESKGQSQKLVLDLNQLRKSLNFWSPEHELTDVAKKHIFVKDGNSVHIRRRDAIYNKIRNLPGFSESLTYIQDNIPEDDEKMKMKVQEVQENTSYPPERATEPDYLNKVFSTLDISKKGS